MIHYSTGCWKECMIWSYMSVKIRIHHSSNIAISATINITWPGIANNLYSVAAGYCLADRQAQYQMMRLSIRLGSGPGWIRTHPAAPSHLRMTDSSDSSAATFYMIFTPVLSLHCPYFTICSVKYNWLLFFQLSWHLAYWLVCYL